MTGYIEVAAVALLSGLVGGIVSGFITETRYRLRLPFSGKTVHLGFLGDGLVGLVSGLTGVVVVGRLFGLNFSVDGMSIAGVSSFPAVTDLQTAALGMVCGFSGIKILSRLSSLVEKQIGELQAKVEAVQLNEDSQFYVWKGRAFLDAGNLDQALVLFDEALTLQPASEEALLEKAKVFKKMALAENDPEKGRRLWDEAIGLLSKAIAHDSNAHRSFYNRSCYRHLAGESKASVLQDLRRAITRADYYRKYAERDPDFRSLQSDPDFQAVLES